MNNQNYQNAGNATYQQAAQQTAPQQNGGYAPQRNGYQQGTPHQNGGYAAQQTAPQQKASYVPQRNGYQQPAMPPQNGGYAAPQGGYPRQVAPQQNGYLQQGMPQQNGGYPAQQGGNGQKQKEYYTKNFFGKTVINEQTIMFATISGFVERVSVRVVNVRTGEQKKVATVDMTAQLPDWKVATNFGDYIIRPDHRVRFHISYWDAAADHIEKLNYADGTRIECMVKGCEINQYQKDDGNILYSINCTGCDFPQYDGKKSGSRNAQMNRNASNEGMNQYPQQADDAMDDGLFEGAPFPDAE